MLEQAAQLKQALVDFVYDAEGDLAVAFEQYVATHGSRDRQDIRLQNLVVDMFLNSGEVDDQTPIDLFLASESDLSASDRDLVKHWQQTFTGLFEIIEIQPESFKLMNWLTAKYYTVFPSPEISQSDMDKWKPGDILLSRIAPLPDGNWMFSGACIPKGKLGKPKLAVVIGEFKDNYPNQLYGDAPDLLEKAWESVLQYHQEFVDCLGSDRILLPGYQLNKKITELQERLSKKQLEAAGIDSSKSLKQIIQEAGVDETEIKASATEAGVDEKSVEQVLGNNDSPMLFPKVQLPDEIKRAEQVMAFSHPRWGQMFVPTYPKFVSVLKAEDPVTQPNSDKLVRKYLEDKEINTFIWQQLKEEYPTQLETLLKAVLERPDFHLERDFESMLKQYNKSLEPQLPEIASVPQHLHQLFEEAVAQVQSKSKSSKKKKKGKGFQEV
ncbi:hypothetical protein WN50_27040 [Limnoraphis robusta CS-951]|uniref:Uncharacterized protein n=2 Tax=Limnoraphis TaxID=1332112 RepID=A0A0F5Y881_9CYAN|nr:hypothetical protein WN50_27040 [Limnoraphis robusta CS-951]